MINYNDIAFGIITAPRDLPTLDYSIKSLRKFLPDCYLNIFSEPGRVEVEGSKMNILVNREQLGALKNYHNALMWILKYSKKPYIWITEDDYAYNSDIIPRLEDAMNHEGDFGFYNMFTNYWNPSLPNPMEEGWTNLELGYYKSWGMSYVIKREVAERMVEHECYKHYVATTDKNIDGVIGETFLQMGLPMYYHNPSPSCSCVIVSTLNHEHKSDGLHFRMNK